MLSAGGLGIQDEDKDWDFGTGAGFYVNATKEPWSEAYRMYSYITEELPDTVLKNFPEIDGERISITGHSMGGHGALMLVSLVSISILLSKLKKSVSQKPWQIQIRFRLRSNFESCCMLMGSKGLLWLLWHR